MGNSLRCCLACVLPCGALDVIRIVHLNGQVEEITRPISAGEVLKANPNYILSKPCSQGVVRRILILSPESDLKRGNIYFLIPASSVPAADKKQKNNNDVDMIMMNSCKKSNYKKKIISRTDQKVLMAITTTTTTTTTTEEEEVDGETITIAEVKYSSSTNTTRAGAGQLSSSSEKKSYRRDHRRIRSREKIRSRDWRPHLESISEDSSKLPRLELA